MITRRSLRPVGIGLAAGSAGAAFAARLLESQLYQVQPHDPAVLLIIALVLGGCATFACLVPARRAAGVDPLTVLREE